MLYSKFSLDIDTKNQIVTIYTTVTANNETWSISPHFKFNEKGDLIIPPKGRGYDRETFSTLARNVKTTVANFKEHIEWEIRNATILPIGMLSAFEQAVIDITEKAASL